MDCSPVDLDRRINAGRGMAARHIGRVCDIYRPNSDAPLTFRVGTLPAAFNAADASYKRPSVYGKALWYGDYDGRLTQPGDYLKRLFDGALWFVAAQQPLLPIVVIECDRTLTLARQAPLAGVMGGYSGVIDPTTIMGVTTPWPASILWSGGSGAAAGLPGDATEATWTILLPLSISVIVESSDIVTDDLGRRFEIIAAELSALGWRLSAKEVHT